MGLTIVHQVDPTVERVAGGIDTFIKDFLAWCTVPVTVLGARRGNGSGEPGVISAAPAAVQIQFVPVTRLPQQRRGIPDSLRMAWGLVRHRRRLAGVVQVHRIDYVLLLRLIAPRVRQQLFLHTDSAQALAGSSDSLWRLIPGIYSFIERLSLRVPHQVFVLSVRDFPRVRELRSDARLAHGWFNDAEFREGKPWAARADRVIWAGRLEEPKDPLLAVRTMKAARDMGFETTLEMYGSGSLRDETLRLVRQLGVEDVVTVSPALSSAELAATLQTSRALIQSSRFEGAPRLPLEAVACGLPVLSTPEGDPEGIVGLSTNGVIAGDRSPESMARALHELIARGRTADSASVAERGASRVVPALVSEAMSLAG